LVREFTPSPEGELYYSYYEIITPIKQEVRIFNIALNEW
jgi:hypothetical protein